MNSVNILKDITNHVYFGNFENTLKENEYIFTIFILFY